MAKFYNNENSIKAFEAPDDTQNYIRRFDVGYNFRDLEHKDANEEWVAVEVYEAGNFRDNVYWIRRSFLQVDEDFVPTFFYDEGFFIRYCVLDAVEYNEKPQLPPFQADFDYLIALASIQSNRNHKAKKGPDAKKRYGIFGITKTEWDEFRTTPPGSDIDVTNHLSPYFQIPCAIHLMVKDAKAVSDLWLADGVGTPEDPYLPRLGELIRCRLFGAQLTFAMQKALKEGKGAEQLDKFLKANGLSDTDVSALFKDRSDFMVLDGDLSKPHSLQTFSDRCDEILNNRLETALNFVKKYVPIAVTIPNGSAPWMTHAEAELAKGVKEGTPAGNAQIANYFDSTGSSSLGHESPWCAAFVAWCLDQCGPEVQNSFAQIKSNAASVAAWRSWGRSIHGKGNQIPKGAIVLLAPSDKTEEASHVGFVAETNPLKDKITIISGNYSDAVSRSNENAANIVDIRWHDFVNPTVGPGAANDLKPLLDLIGEVESDGNYNAKNGNSGNEHNPRFTDMTIAEVLDWQQNNTTGGHSSAAGKYQIVRATLEEVIANEAWGPVIALSELYNEVTQEQLALKLLKKRHLDAFLASSISVEKFGQYLAQEWAALPVLAPTYRKHVKIEAGQSYYAGVGNNKVGAKVPDMVEKLSTLNPNAPRVG